MYGVVFIPIFETQKVVNRTARKIRSKIARQMIIWSHYTIFRKMLLNMAKFGLSMDKGGHCHR